MIIKHGIMELTELLYTKYSEAVGGVNFRGEPLPTWKEFDADPTKTKQAHAWITIGELVVLLAQQDKL